MYPPQYPAERGQGGRRETCPVIVIDALEHHPRVVIGSRRAPPSEQRSNWDALALQKPVHKCLPLHDVPEVDRAVINRGRDLAQRDAENPLGRRARRHSAQREEVRSTSPRDDSRPGRELVRQLKLERPSQARLVRNLQTS